MFLWTRYLALTFGAAICTLIAIFPALPFARDITAIRVYSVILCGYKWAMACFLICVGILYFQKWGCYVSPLLLGFSIYGCVLAANQYIPLFAPVYSGRPTEFGGLVLLLLIVGDMIACDLRIYQQGVSAQAQVRATQNELQIQKERVQTLERYLKKTAVRRHEFNSYLMLLRLYLENREYEKMEALILALCGPGPEEALPVYTQHPLVNSILASKFSYASTLHIQTDGNLVIPAVLPLEDTDLCSLLTNLLDNAIEGCGRLAENQSKWLQLVMHLRGDYLVLTVKNTAVFSKAGNRRTSKAEPLEHGYGTQIIHEIIEKYHGLINIDWHDGIYEIRIALLLSEKSNGRRKMEETPI